MLNGEILSDESKTATANALNMGLAYVEKIQQKKNPKIKHQSKLKGGCGCNK